MKTGDLVVLLNYHRGGVDLYNDLYMSNYISKSYSSQLTRDPSSWRTGIMFNLGDVGIVLDEGILNFTVYNKILVKEKIGWIYTNFLRVVE